MADVKIPALPNGSALTGTESIPMSQGGISKKTTTAAIAALASQATSVVQFAASDETTSLTTGTAEITLRMPFALTLTAVRASLSTASSSGLVTVDIKKNGLSILSTKITIDATEKTSKTAATPAVISDANLADDDEITVDIVGAGTGAAGLKVALLGTA